MGREGKERNEWRKERGGWGSRERGRLNWRERDEQREEKTERAVMKLTGQNMKYGK